ncbi:MAG: response regulator [Planctomycetota bacterium]|nr:response regulator [Planctomycetota bacterium]
MSAEKDQDHLPGEETESSQPTSILVVDDSVTIRALLKDALEKDGYRVVEAEDGEDGMHVALRERPDLIIADINMPKVNGWEFCWNLRKHDELRHVPFIFLTDRYGVSDRMRGLSVGAEDYITKPFDARDLIHRMHDVFKRDREEHKTTPKEAEASLMGKVQQFPLPDVLQNINRAGGTGILEVRRGSKTGRFHIRQGDVINSSLEKLRGRKAFFRLIVWEEGIFEFREQEPEIEEVFEESTIRLILDGLKQQDEMRLLQERLPGGDAVLTLVGVDDEGADEKYPPAIRALFDLIRQYGILCDVVDASPLDDIKIYRAVALLIESGVLRTRDGG